MATPTSPDDIPVTHHESEQRFEAQVYGELSVCEYQREGDRVVFTHTYVPPELRGRGVAAKLVRVALEWARQHKLQIVPACSYVAAYLDRHPEYQTQSA